MTWSFLFFILFYLDRVLISEIPIPLIIKLKVTSNEIVELISKPNKCGMNILLPIKIRIIDKAYLRYANL